MEIILATNNRHKVDEIKAATPAGVNVISLHDAVGNIDIPETGETLEANAAIKARAIWALTQRPCLSDDTGLEVEALGGAPGVYSARYAGEGCSFLDNVNKLLREMEGKTDRRARFRTVICLIINNKEYFFEGIVNGHITTRPRGVEGFGYDPIFKPDGSDRTFAQMTLDEKNAISHRGLAVQAVSKWLSNNPQSTL